MKNQTLQQFHAIAIQHKLSATAILLWQYIYFIATAECSYANLCLRTAELTEALDITRNGLQKVRRTLVTAGLLEVHIDHRQKVFYTLMINKKMIGENDDKTAVEDGDLDVPLYDRSNTGDPNTTRPVAKPRIATKSTNNDIIHNNAYRKLIDAFCAGYDSHDRITLEMNLQQFLHQRKRKGKTLTKSGLDALLDKLVTLAQNNIRIMIGIVQQSINRGWMGFYPCNAAISCRGGCPQPPAYVQPAAKGRISKYDTKYEDLDFLEW